MKLHHLTFEGVGPFQKKVAIDFTALGESGIFLLEGATGSGKSTIIDAIVYALYGDVAGRDSSKSRIRSDFTPNTQESYVDLVFEVPAGIYRVRRTPQYMRAARRGKKKEISANATAKLWKLNSPAALTALLEGSELAADIEPLASRPADVGTHICEIIGLTHDQFTQTVVLPQGEFARFLRADTKERKKVLERVFGTQFYQRIEEAFAEARQSANRTVETSKSQLRETYGRILEAASLSDDGHANELHAVESFSPLSLERAGERARELVAETAEASNEASEALKRAVTQLLAAEKIHAGAQEKIRMLQERRALDQMIERRTAIKEEALEAATRVKLHHAAEKAFYALEQAAAASTRLDKQREALAQEYRNTPETWATHAAKQAEVARSYAAHAAELTALVLLEKEIPAQEKLLTEAKESVAETAQTAKQAQAAVDARPAEREKLFARRAEVAEAAGGVAAAKAQLDSAKAHVAAAQRALAIEQKLDGVKEELAQAVERATHAVRKENLLRQQRLDSIAYEIAGKLEPGEPCPVCGSEEHPNPAHSTEETVSPEHITQAEEHRRRAERAVSEYEAHLSALGATLTAERTQAHRAVVSETTGTAGAEVASTGTTAIDASDEATTAIGASGTGTIAIGASDEATTSPLASSEPARSQFPPVEQQALVAASTAQLAEWAQQDQREAKSLLDAATVAAKELSCLESKISAFDEATAACMNTLASAQAAAERAATTAEVKATELAANMKKISEARGGEYPTVAARQQALQRSSEAHQKNSEKFSAAEQARVQHHELVTYAMALIEQSNFSTEGAVRSARLSDALRGELEELTTTYSNLDSAISEALKKPALASFDASEEAAQMIQTDLQKADSDLANAREAHTRAAGDHSMCESIAQRTRAATEAFNKTVAQHNRSTARQAQVVHLANIVTGNSSDSKARLTLSTFAVMRRFESVVEAANTRLATLSGGDFEICLAEPEKSGNKQVGLDLRVVDRRNDRAREPHTLSGGETFYVSLALALGLADIVSAESGGIQMNTLFIDEGFGSLDPEKLEGVVAEIRELASHGRTVGIVSHVAELKAQIPEKIHVERTAQGTSTARITV